MGKKKHRHDWPEAKKLCRLNQNDIAMAKSLGFGPDSLVRARPDPKQQWKLPVKEWIHELHFKRFGFVLGAKPLPEQPPSEEFEYDEEALRAPAAKDKSSQPGATRPDNVTLDKSWMVEPISDEDVPF